jgi:transaldolase
VDRPNVLIKIPGTDEGLPAVTQALGEGISVNVTLIFSPGAYDKVMDAWLAGLELADRNGVDLSTVHSVASFFVSRVDTEVDKRLEAIGTPEATALLGRAAIANARIAYKGFAAMLQTPRWQALAAKGAVPQRPLWASTGVKDPQYNDTRYVVDLVTEGVVNTMPEKTLLAVADHGEVVGDTITGAYADAEQVFTDLAGVGIDLDDVFAVLLEEGVTKFVQAWEDLLDNLAGALEQRGESSGS